MAYSLGFGSVHQPGGWLASLTVPVLAPLALVTFDDYLLWLTAGLLAVVILFLGSRRASVVFLYAVPALMAIEYRLRMGPVSFALSEVATLLVWVLALLRIFTRQKGAPFLLQKELALLSFTALAAIPAVAVAVDTKHFLSAYRDFVGPFLFFLGFALLGMTSREALVLVRVAVVLATLSVFLGFVQYSTGEYRYFQTFDEGWEQFKVGGVQTSTVNIMLGRSLPVGLFSTVNNFSLYLFIPLFAAAALGSSAQATKAGQLLWRAAAVLLFVGICLTLLRSAMLAAVGGFAVLAWMRRGRRQLLLAIFLSVLGASVAWLALLGPSILAWDGWGSLRGRVDMLTVAQDVLQGNPLLVLTGGATERYMRTYYGEQLVHHLAFYVILQFGLFAAIGFVAFWIVLLWRFLRTLRMDNPESPRLLAALVVGLGSMIFLLGQVHSLIPTVQIAMNIFFWAGMAHGLCAPAEIQPGVRLAAKLVRTHQVSPAQSPEPTISARPNRCDPEDPRGAWKEVLTERKRPWR